MDVIRPQGEQGADLVFSVVWTGTVFERLSLFTDSLLDATGARFRFVANQCPAEQIAAMERYAEDHDGRIVEVLDVSSRVMIRHGDALDAVLRTRDDGDHFCFIDPDICARKPFLGPFLHALETAAAVTSGRELWSTHNVRPADHPGVSGEHFFDQDGFVFGSPHLALYRREPLLATMDRWGVGFSSAGNDITEATRARLADAGRDYWIFDTAKIVNVLLQADGHVLEHIEHADLVHIGGLSHFLAPPVHPPDAGPEEPRPWGTDVWDWGKWEGQSARYAVAGYTARVLDALQAGDPVPDPPIDVDPGLADRVERVRESMVELFDRYGGLPQPTAGRPR